MKQKLHNLFLLLAIAAIQAISIGWVFGKIHLLIIGAIAGIIGLAGLLLADSNKKE